MLNLKPILQLNHPCMLPKKINYGLLWHAGWFSRPMENPRHNWSGFMQEITSSFSSEEKSSITFLPIINLNPSDENCIYSTLLFIMNQVRALNIALPCVTFGQPLWLKAIVTIDEAKLEIVCRLRGFHTMMSFLGSVGNLMKESGLQEMFAEVYAGHTMIHMISGKAISRALRAHFLVGSALMTSFSKILIEEESIDISSFESLFDDVLAGETDIARIDHVFESQDFMSFSKALKSLKEKLAAKSRTAKLWIVYLDWTINAFCFSLDMIGTNAQTISDRTLTSHGTWTKH